MSEIYTTGTGQKIYVHEREPCTVGPCVIHCPSTHHMFSWPTHWRHDRGIMERICPHGVGHPDPDCKYVASDSIHGCDGCCQLSIQTDQH